MPASTIRLILSWQCVVASEQGCPGQFFEQLNCFAFYFPSTNSQQQQQQVVGIKLMLAFFLAPLAPYERQTEFSDLRVFYFEATSVCVCFFTVF